MLRNPFAIFVTFIALALLSVVPCFVSLPATADPPKSSRYDPYKAYRFLVYFGNSSKPVAGVSKVAVPKAASATPAKKSGGDVIVRKGVGRTKYEAITLERGVTIDTDFNNWANNTQVLDNGAASQPKKTVLREVRIVLLNEAGRPVQRYIVHRCRVSEYQALPDLDAGSNTIAIQHIKLENEGWESDHSVTEKLTEKPKG